MINTIKTAAAKFSVILKEYGILQSQCPHLILNVSCVVNLFHTTRKGPFQRGYHGRL
jgi:hypothetical protein